MDACHYCKFCLLGYGLLWRRSGDPDGYSGAGKWCSETAWRGVGSGGSGWSQRVGVTVDKLPLQAGCYGCVVSAVAWE